MRNDYAVPRYYAETFGGEDYSADYEENLGYRTPFQDADMKRAEDMFTRIIERSRTQAGDDR